MEPYTFHRDIVSKISARIREDRRFIQVISGPRQVGKTTAILQVLKQIELPYQYAVADLPAPPHEGWISQQWELARRQLQAAPKVILVLDEVQKISHWSEEVKRLWDEDSRKGNNIQVIILGSSALLIHKGLDESLAGRFEVIRCSHWSFKECQSCFQWPLEKFIYFGGYPGAAHLAEDETRWARYIRDSLIETFISKDVLLLNRVEKPALLRQLFVLACEYGGQILSYQKMLGQLAEAGNTTTLAHYQALLESAFIIRGLSILAKAEKCDFPCVKCEISGLGEYKWSAGRVNVRKSSPKWLPLNSALMTALSNKSCAEWRSAPELWGRLVEVSVGAYIVNQASEQQLDVYYWRKGNYEVDFIIQKGKNLLALEVKSGQRKDHLDGLVQFLKENKKAKLLVVGLGGVDLQTFLETPVLHWFD